MNRIKVLQLPISNSKGGITTYVLQNWEFIDHSRFQFDFATRSAKLDFAEELEAQGCKIHYLSCSSDENEEKFIEEINLILDEGYNAVHLHTSYWKGFLVEKIAMARKVPVVIIHAHSTMVDELDETKRAQAIEKHMKLRDEISLHDGTHFLACSSNAGGWLFGKNIPKNQIQIMPNAVDLKKFDFSEESRNNLRKELNLEECIVLGHIGRFCYQKNHEFLIGVFKEINRCFDRVKLVLIGSGPLEGFIRDKINEYNLNECVLMLGYRDDISELLSCMDLFLMPSYFEGLGIVLVEAQSNGLPCIVSSSIPAEASFSDNVTVLELNKDEWVETIEVMIKKGCKRHKDQEILIKRGYDLSCQIHCIEALYQSRTMQ